MRFMVIVKATRDSEASVVPSEQVLADMGKYNEELAKAGVLLAAEGSIRLRKARASGPPVRGGP